MNLPNTPPISSQAEKQLIYNILLVEDSPVQAQRLKTVLETEGPAVSVVGDGLEAIEQAHKHDFDLIILDVELPTLNGYETCRCLKDSPITANVPVIMLTSRDGLSDTLNGLELGVTDYIAKDAFAEATLVQTIRLLNQGAKL